MLSSISPLNIRLWAVPGHLAMIAAWCRHRSSEVILGLLRTQSIGWLAVSVDTLSGRQCQVRSCSICLVGHLRIQ